jgi:hypothetical protein
MAYSINKTDGSILATVADGQLDQFSTDITFIGKNYSGFGEVLNENFVKILENFADTAAPTKPIRGQIWFDASELKLKVYNGLAFVPVSSATIASSQPLTLGVGDLWFDDLNKQLYFYDGANTILLGPDFSATQGLSGLKVVNILDTLNQNRVITYLYTNGILLGIFSKDAFTPKLPIDGFSGDIIPGFNAGTLPGIKFNVTSTNSERLGGQVASAYVRNDTSNIINGQLILASNLGLIVGDASQAQLLVNNGDVILANIASDKNINLLVRKGVQAETAVNINTLDRKINLYTGFELSTPVPEINIGGNLIVAGNLTVQGDTTTVNTSVLTIEDKNIVLGSLGDSSANNDEYADGGGLILKGASDHEFTWARSSASWYSTEHINLATSKSIKINGVTILTATECLVPTFPNVNQFGPQLSLTVDSIFVDNNRISTIGADQDLEIAPNGAGNISLIGSPRIIGLSTTGQIGISQQTEHTGSITNSVIQPNPPLSSTELSETVNKQYMLNTIRTRSIVLSMDISDGISNGGIAGLLTQIAPPREFENGTRARILCSFLSASSSTLNINPLVNTSTAQFVTPSSGTAPAVIEPVAFSTATIPAPIITPTRVVKEFVLQSGVWTFVS